MSFKRDKTLPKDGETICSYYTTSRRHTPYTVVGGRLGLGPSQGLFLCEHRDVGGFGGGLNRRLVLTLQGLESP
jgi:hypothetical protein